MCPWLFCFFFCFLCALSVFFFFFNETATTEIYTLSLHDALPIYPYCDYCKRRQTAFKTAAWIDRKSTRLNSSHVEISYAVFCLKKKNKHEKLQTQVTKYQAEEIKAPEA